MAGLTKTQLDHAKTRIAEAKANYIERLLAPLGKRPEVPEYNDGEKLAMIVSGHATLKNNKDNLYGYITNAFEYPRAPEMQLAQGELDAWKLQRDTITAKANTTEQQLLDELIMSPDGAAALRMIATAFA